MCFGGGGDEPRESESKNALAQQAANALSRYGDVFVPLENMYINDTKAMFADGASDLSHDSDSEPDLSNI